MKQTIIRICSLAAAISLVAGLAACGNDKGAASQPGSGSGSSSASAPASGSSSTAALDYSKGIDDKGFWAGVKALDYVTLPQYKGVELPQDKITASAEDIQSVKDGILEEFGTPEQITDRAVAEGDQVNIDYVGSVDGVEFTGGTTGGKGTTVTAGATNYIDDFLTQIIGHKPGETVNVVVTFPEDYRDSTDADGNAMVLANKEATFVTVINYIEGDTIYPELTDSFVAENLKADYSWTTLAEMDAGIVETIEENNKYNYLLDYLTENAVITEVPASITDVMTEMNIISATNTAAQNGLDLATFLTLSGFESEDAFRTQVADQSVQTARQQLVFQAIAETENLEVTEADLTEAFGENLNQILEYYGNGYPRMQILFSKVAELLMAEN